MKVSHQTSVIMTVSHQRILNFIISCSCWLDFCQHGCAQRPASKLSVSQNPYRRQLILQRWANITAMVDMRIKSIVACKQAFQAGAAVPFHRSLTNGWARTASHTKSTINHTPATLHYCLCRHFIALHFVWKCILDASYCKCSWHCPDKYALHTLIISSNFSDESTNQASKFFLLQNTFRANDWLV